MDPHHHPLRPPHGPPGGPPFYPGGPPPGVIMAPFPGGPFGGPPPFRPPMIPFLPPGWTEHRAPDGMAYFYNAATGQSSWVRPAPPPLPAGAPGMPPPPGVQHFPLPGFHPGHQQLPPPGHMAAVPGPVSGAPEPTSAPKEDLSTASKKTKKAKKEKAVKKVQVLDSPWFIVTTSHDNTFYYNKETKSSIWTPAQELEILLTKMGQIETEKRKAEADRLAKEEQDRLSAAAAGTKRSNGENLSKEDGEKRSKTESSITGQDTNVGTEMTEEDVAWQLAAMEDMMEDQDQDEDMQSQGDDSENDADVQARLQKLQKESQKPSWAENLDISEDNIQEREMLFLNMMRDRGVTQFDTWERAFSKIERDPRMYLIPGKKDRQALFDSFCTIRAQEIKAAKEKKEQEEKEEAERKEKRDKERHQHGSRRDSSSSSSKPHDTSKSEAAMSSVSKPEAIYRRLMEEYTTKSSTWLDFMTKYRVDPRFLALKPGSLRESIFRKYLSDLKKGILPTTKTGSSSSVLDDKKRSSSSSHSSSSSKKYKATKDEIDEFMSLLKETKKDILYEHKHSSSVEWKKIKRAIDRDRRYDAVGSSTEREMLFREYADKVIQRRD